MRHKLSIENKLDRIESKLKKIAHYIKMGENKTAFEGMENILDDIGDIRTLLNGENQD